MSEDVLSEAKKVFLEWENSKVLAERNSFQKELYSLQAKYDSLFTKTQKLKAENSALIRILKESLLLEREKNDE